MTQTPLTVIGGFLGAGKTTLLNNILRDPGGRRITALVNDFGKINIDAELVAKHDGRTIALSNGCVCCTIGNSLIAALIRLTRQPELPDHIVIETSGIADPGRVAEIAFLEPSIGLAGVIVVADAEQVRELAADRYVGDAVGNQLHAADILILNKVDLTSASEREDTLSWLRQFAAGPRIVQATHAGVPVAVVLGPAHDGRRIRLHPSANQQYAAGFASTVVEAARPFRMGALRHTLDTLPASILRAKGVLLTDENPKVPAILQLVGKRWSLEPDAGRAIEPGSRLVIIGLADGFDPEDIRARFVDALGGE